jgi:hypothetical protein
MKASLQRPNLGINRQLEDDLGHILLDNRRSGTVKPNCVNSPLCGNFGAARPSGLEKFPKSPFFKHDGSEVEIAAAE